MTDTPPGSPPPGLGPPSIWAPWRLKYLEDSAELDSAGADAEDGAAGAGAQGETKASPHPSFLRAYWLDPASDAANHVVVRSGEGLILLNAYPYSNGHLLVALAEPRSRLLDYEPGQRAALWGLVDLAVDLLERAVEPHGVNVGINQGRAAGAGVPQHLHAHVVPRWAGDVNFMTTIGQIRVVPSSLDAMADRLASVAREMGIAGAVSRG